MEDLELRFLDLSTGSCLFTDRRLNEAVAQEPALQLHTLPQTSGKSISVVASASNIAIYPTSPSLSYCVYCNVLLSPVLPLHSSSPLHTSRPKLLSSSLPHCLVRESRSLLVLRAPQVTTRPIILPSKQRTLTSTEVTMDPPFPGDGQPSSYTNTLPGHGQQSPCVAELTGMGSYYALSSGPQDQPPHLSSTGPLPQGSTLSQHQDNQQRSQPIQDATAYTSISSGFHYPPRSHHQVWPSPPPGPDDYDNYSYQSSPSSGSAPMSCYNPSPISPRTWSSPDFPLSQASESLHQQSQQNPYHNLRICTPTSTEGFPVIGSQVLTPFSSGCMNQGFDNEIDGMPHNYSPVTIPSSSVGALSCTSSPQEPLLSTPMHMETRQESPAGGPDYRVSTDEQLDAKDGKDVVAGAKTEEPYAKLLYRALMSAPDHAMTLQEIYQWFRENTDKDVKKENTPKRPGKNAEGWQNSIRHNLSMNEVRV